MCWKINFLRIHWYFAAIFISLAEINLSLYLFDQVFLTLLMKTYSISISSLPTSLWVTVSFSVHSLCILNRNNCTLRHIRVYLMGSFWLFLCNLLYLLLSPPRSRRLYRYGHSHRHSLFLTPPRSLLSVFDWHPQQADNLRCRTSHHQQTAACCRGETNSRNCSLEKRGITDAYFCIAMLNGGKLAAAQTCMHVTWSQCLFNVGPLSAMLVKHSINIDLTSRVCFKGKLQ